MGEAHGVHPRSKRRGVALVSHPSYVTWRRTSQVVLHGIIDEIAQKVHCWRKATGSVCSEVCILEMACRANHLQPYKI